MEKKYDFALLENEILTLVVKKPIFHKKISNSEFNTIMSYVEDWS